MANLWQPSINRALDRDGNPASGAKLFVYRTNSVINELFYLDDEGLVPGSNPVIANSEGILPAIYLDSELFYRMVLLTNSGSETIYDVDPVRGFDESSAATASMTAVDAATTAQTAALQATTAAVGVDAGVATVNDATTRAEDAATRAEDAAASTVADGQVYSTEAEGRAAVTDGQTFLVESLNGAFADLYRRSNATTSEFVTSYPSQQDVANSINSGSRLVGELGETLASSIFSVAFTNTGHIAANNVGQGNGGFFTFIDAADINSEFVDGVASRIGVAATAANIRVTPVLRDLSDTDLNSPFPQASDTELPSGLTSSEGIPVNNVGLSKILSVPRIVVPTTGMFALGFKIEAIDATGSNVDMAHDVGRFGPYTQRRAGWRFNVNTPSTFSTENPIQAPDITLYENRARTDVIESLDTLEKIDEERAQQLLADMNSRNFASITALCGAFSPDLGLATNIGDSLREQAQAAAEDANSVSTAIIDSLTQGIVNNYGIGGQTASQITDRIVNAGGSTAANFMTAEERAGVVMVQMGTNDLGGNLTSAQILDFFATAETAITGNHIFLSPTSGGQLLANTSSSKARDIAKGLIANYGDNAVDMHQMWSRYGADIDADFTFRAGHYPAHLRTDATHANAAGASIQGYEEAALFLAANNIGSYVHDDIVSFTEVAGSTVHTIRKLGNAGSYKIIAGNDGSFVLDPITGQIDRTSQPIKKDYYELFVQGFGRHGGGRIGRIVAMKSSISNTPNSPIAVAGNGQSALTRSTNDVVPTGGEIFIVIRCRFKSGVVGGIIGSNATTLSLNGDRISFTPRFTSGPTLAIIPSVEKPYDYQTYFFTVDGPNGIAKGQASEGASASATPTDADIDFDRIDALLNSNNAPLKNMDIDFIGIYARSYDTEDINVRSRFYDPVTGQPKDLSDPTFGGAMIEPWVLMFGEEYDWWSGRNRGTGADWNAPVPIGPAYRGFKKAQD